MNEKNYLTENMDSLTPDLREAISKIDYLGGLRKIQRDKKLHIDQAATLEKLTFMLMLGEIDEDQYLSKLSRELGITTPEAEDIGGEVQGTILEPIIQEFKKIEHQSVPENETSDKNTEAEIPTAPHTNETLKSAGEPEIQIAPTGSFPTRESILASIEDPVSPTTAMTIPSTNADLPVAVAASYATPKTNTTFETAPKPIDPSSNTPTRTPLVSPEVAAALNNNLKAPVTNKPTRITTSIDPYLEAIE